MLKVTVDPARCRSYAVCLAVADDLFELDRHGQARIVTEHAEGVPEEYLDLVEEAAEKCPVAAITVEQVADRPG